MTTPPASFVAERNRLVKELRASGEVDTSAAVAKLRRPPLTDWALNMTAAEQPEAVADLADAAAAMAAAQETAMAGRDAGDVRVAMPRLREQVSRVAALAATIAAREGQTGVGSSAAELAARVTQLVAVPEAMALLRRGLLGVEDTALTGPLAAPPAPSERTSKDRLAAKPAAGAKRPSRRADHQPAAPAADELVTRRAAAEAARRRCRGRGDAGGGRTLGRQARGQCRRRPPGGAGGAASPDRGERRPRTGSRRAGRSRATA